MLKWDGVGAAVKWADVPLFLREKFKAAGFDNARKLTAAINADPGQQKIRGISALLSSTAVTFRAMW